MIIAFDNDGNFRRHQRGLSVQVGVGKRAVILSENLFMRRQGQHPGRAPVAISPCPSIVLYGAGSPLLVDYEETCRRCGLEIVAIVKNIECPSCTSDPAKVLELSAASRELFDHDVAIPLFTPGNRRKAFEEVASLGAQRFRPLIDPSAILPTAVTIER